MLQIKHYETLETFNNEKSNLETPWVAYVEENSTIYYSVDDVIKYRVFLVKQKDISNITYEAIDLGLPSGLKWADKNVGATSPEDFGSYFQWGDTIAYTFDGEGEITPDKLAEILNHILGPALGTEITEDNVGMTLEQIGITGTDLTNIPAPLYLSLDKEFSWEAYFDTNDCGSTFNKYNNNGGLTVLESVDDVATVHMGNTWRMPTTHEIGELIDNTTQTFIDLNGNEYSQEQVKNGAIEEGKLKGARFIGPSGNSIFIPAAGWCIESILDRVAQDSKLWSSNLDDGTNDDDAIYLTFHGFNGSINKGVSSRYQGLPVRGVLK